LRVSDRRPRLLPTNYCQRSPRMAETISPVMIALLLMPWVFQ
jgi:hypothetical protein